MKSIIFFCSILFSTITIAQPLSYIDHEGDKHLVGSISIEDLQSDPYKDWFNSSYEEGPSEKAKWSKKLKGTEVEVYLGTWCGDSKNWVPKFVKLWDELGLDRNQLDCIALYSDQDRYKQGPSGEEKGKDIHRVPTFIFKENGEEYARIVESPSTDLVTDLAQIALGYAAEPNYMAATYLLDLFKMEEIPAISESLEEHKEEIRRKVMGSSELHTLGNVLLYSDRTEEALVVFQINSMIFPFDPRAHFGVGKTLETLGKSEEAISSYEKALDINPEYTYAEKRLSALK